MKVYFAAAIYARDKLALEYKTIIDEIKNLGHDVITAYDVFNDDWEKILAQTNEQSERFFLRRRRIVVRADVAVVEATFPSTVNIGLELYLLAESGKPTICLYTQGRNPSFVGKFHSSRLIKVEYSLDDINAVLEWSLAEAKEMLERRFTMIIPAKIEKYLDGVVKEKGLSRSEYIRKLIEREMKR